MKNGQRMRDEGDREPGAAPHVKNPAKPVQLRGTPPLSVAWAEIQKRAAEAKVAVACKDGQTRFRAQRSDAAIGLAAVASFHIPTAQVKSPEHKAQLKDWINKTLDHLTAEHGKPLSAVLHVDEGYPHIHAWFAPDPGKTVASIHPGIAARDAAAKAQPTKRSKSGGEARNRGGKEYVEAMRAYQDRYHAAVGARFGEARIGPGRQRLSRAEWQAQQAAAKATAEALRAYEKTAKAAAAKAQEATSMAAKAEAEAKAATSAKDSREHIISHQNGRISQLKSALDDVSERRNNLIDAVLDAQDEDDLRVIQDELRASSSTQNTAHAPSLSPTQK